MSRLIETFRVMISALAVTDRTLLRFQSSRAEGKHWAMIVAELNQAWGF
jgi:hypothetical protein